ncbi:hypothetical protein Y032_0623g767 [Ancylostoma ceylanicum]|uniref:Uncharacterized protein n=1 Tax=Ancylostoma ceylanicum TaxID=53326 RepID=A0A016WKR7_9BILA|nr:hypothetical protein Y032_0623g767 [Ancylostoma ceylanicum]
MERSKVLSNSKSCRKRYIQSTLNGRRQGAGPRHGQSGCPLHRGSGPSGQRHWENRYVVISRCLRRCSRRPEWAAHGPALVLAISLATMFSV